jgi:ribonuclease HI
MDDGMSEYVVDFERRNVIKSQILVDFVAEWTEPSSLTDDVIPKASWLVYCDGAWGNAGAEAAAILVSPSGIKLRYTTRLQFHNEADKCTNNIAECEGILLGLHKLRAIIVQICTLRTDSKVVVDQIEKECNTREPTLERYLTLVKRMECYFKGITVEYIERTKNSEADELVKAVTRNTPLLTNVFFQVILDMSIKTVKMEPKVFNLIEGEDWHTPIMAYLRHYYELDSAAEHTKIQQRARAY